MSSTNKPSVLKPYRNPVKGFLDFSTGHDPKEHKKQIARLKDGKKEEEEKTDEKV